MDSRWIIPALLGTFALLVALPFVGGYLQGQAHDCPPTLHAAKASPGAVDEPPVPFSDLSDRRQREFERAVAGGHPEVEATEDAWVETRFVAYRDSNYSTAVAVC